MKQLLFKTLAGSGLLLTALTAYAQQYPAYPDRAPIQSAREVEDQSRLFDRVRNDLDQVSAGTIPFSSDRSRVTAAMELLNDCQRTIDDGTYDRRLFDQTVSSIQRVIELNHVTDQSRSYLSDDVRELTRLQSRLEGF
jgi:hypothetical protein